MKKKEYTTPQTLVAEYFPMMIVAMSWSDEETGEVLAPNRGSDKDDDWESFWESRE